MGIMCLICATFQEHISGAKRDLPVIHYTYGSPQQQLHYEQVMPKWLNKRRLAMYITGNTVARFCNYTMETQQCVLVFFTIHC
jgi:hypothetical protein